jgi:hypothetical protein
MSRNTGLRVVAVAAAFLIAAGGAFAVAHFTTEDATPDVPRAARPVPVLAPVRRGATPASGAEAASPGTEAGGAGGGTPAGGGGTAATGGGGSAAPSTPAAPAGSTPGDGAPGGGGADAGTETTTTVAPGEPGGPGAPSAALASAASRVVSAIGDAATPGFGLTGASPHTPRFIDPCDLGATGGGECDGTLGTVLGAGEAIVSPLVIYALAPFPAVSRPHDVPRCDFGTLGEHDVPVLIETNNPARFTVHFGQPSSSGLSALYRVETHTPAAEQALWDGWAADDTTGVAFGNVVQTCVVLRNGTPPAEARFDYTVDGDDGRTTASGTFALTGPHRRAGRPPVLVGVIDENHVRVSAPFRPEPGANGPAEHVITFATSTVSDDVVGADRTCAGIEAYGLDRFRSQGEHGRVVAESAEDLPADSLRLPGYPFSTEYSRAQLTDLRLDEGTPHHVCVWWVTGPSNRVVEREERLVTPPSRYRLRVVVESVDLIPRAAEGRAVSARVMSTADGGALCSPAFVTGPGQTLCDLTGSGDTARLGDAVDLQIEGPFSSAWQSTRIPVPRWSCGATGDSGVRACTPEQDASYTVTVPGSHIVGLCGGTGSCDPPTAGGSVGTITFRFEFVDGPDAAGRDYQWGTASPFFGPDVAVQPPPYPVATNVAVTGMHPDSLEFTVDADRPVTVRVYRVDWRDGSACVQPGATDPAPSGPAITNRLVVGGLCPGQQYWFGFELTDATGARSYVGARPSGAPDEPVLGARLAGFTPSAPASVLAELTILAAPTRPGTDLTFVESALVRIDADPVPDTWGSGALGCQPIGHTTPPTRWSAFAAESQVIAVEAIASSGASTCSAGGTRATTSIRQTVSLADLLAGAVTLESPEGDALRVRVRLVTTLSSS